MQKAGLETIHIREAVLQLGRLRFHVRDSDQGPNWCSLSSKLTCCLDDLSGFRAPPTELETSELHLRT
jgi:hypothetical protein